MDKSFPGRTEAEPQSLDDDANDEDYTRDNRNYDVYKDNGYAHYNTSVDSTNGSGDECGGSDEQRCKPGGGIWASPRVHSVATCNNCLESFTSNDRLHQHLREHRKKCPPTRRNIYFANRHPNNNSDDGYSGSSHSDDQVGHHNYAEHRLTDGYQASCDVSAHSDHTYSRYTNHYSENNSAYKGDFV